MQTPMKTPVVIRQQGGANLLVRALYFVVFGLWFSGLWAAIAWIFCVTIVGLPIGLWMLNRLPQVVTLAPSNGTLVINAAGEVRTAGVRQLPFLVRALWFVLVGWWLSALWIALAWALCASIIGMILGFWMFDRVPAIITLRRG